jgi:hypothetical protein
VENNDKSEDLSREFLDLKRDVGAFADRFALSARNTAIPQLANDIEV